MLERLGNKCPKIVRVYSEDVECSEFPIGRESVRTNTNKNKLLGKDCLKDVALHHLIRKPGRPYADEISRNDKLCWQTMSDDEKERCKEVIMKASIHEIQQCDVILVTCSASPCYKIGQAANIDQCIIDESGMCQEAESLIPLVAYQPSQVWDGSHKIQQTFRLFIM